MPKEMKQRSVSSVLAERREQRKAVTPSKISVRYVKFSPEEMGYDPTPEETAHWVPVGKGAKAFFAKRAEGKTVTLEADVARVYKDSATVNKVLRELMKARSQPSRKRKIA